MMERLKLLRVKLNNRKTKTIGDKSSISSATTPQDFAEKDITNKTTPISKPLKDNSSYLKNL